MLFIGTIVQQEQGATTSLPLILYNYTYALTTRFCSVTLQQYV